MIGDVQVVGLVPETVQLADIGMDVPHGVSVWIPGAKAQESRDLWRAISQRRVIKVGHTGPTPLPTAPPQIPKPSEDVVKLHARIATLEAEKATLEAEKATLEVALETEKAKAAAKLDEILALLKAAPSSGPVTTSGKVSPTVTRNPVVVDVAAPMFIPTQIKGDATDARVTVAEGDVEGGGISDAREALRRLRKTEG